jgi:hypothetical protein
VAFGVHLESKLDAACDLLSVKPERLRLAWVAEESSGSNPGGPTKDLGFSYRLKFQNRCNHQVVVLVSEMGFQ